MRLEQVEIPTLTKIAKDKMYAHLIKIGRDKSYALDIIESIVVQGAQKDETNQKIWITFRRKKGHYDNKNRALKDVNEVSDEINISFPEYMSYYREEKLNNLILENGNKS